ncbi:T9SS type A sorting domain-containing protein [Runella sp. SP2]|uniref:T9SS type A sorting domain-containing protein n=1 Tax=Runella sp. SP2 TaxID=2268026 RepID=UPI00197E469C|nr:T9SS type A sorting domain-containing protein [Runella sp. SP2]
MAQAQTTTQQSPTSSTRAAATCTFTPSNITVSFPPNVGGTYGFSGPSYAAVTYTPDGSLNGAPKWSVTSLGQTYVLRWSGAPNNRWEILHVGANYVAAYNSSGNINTLPCASTNWIVDEEYGSAIVLGGGCGSLTATTVTPSVSVNGSPSGAIPIGTSVTFTATPTNGGTTPSYQWKKNDTNVGTNSATYSDATLANGDKIKVVMTSSDACASPSTATSNELTMSVTTVPSSYTISGACISNTAILTLNGTTNDKPRYTKMAHSDVFYVAGVYDPARLDIYWMSSTSRWVIDLNNSGTDILYYNTTNSAQPPTTGWVNTDPNNNCQIINGPFTITTQASCTNPTAYNVTGTGSYCAGGAGVTVGLSNSETGVTYQLKNASNANVGSPVSGTTGSPITFGNQTAGTYTVVATRTSGSCTATMTGSAVVTENAAVSPSVSIASSDADNSIYAGTSVTFTATPTNGGTTPSYQWKKNDTNVGTNSATYSDATLANGDKIKVVMTSSDACASPSTATSNELTMTVNAAPAALCITTECTGVSGNYTKGSDYNGRPTYTRGGYSIFQADQSWFLVSGEVGDRTEIIYEALSTAQVPPTVGWGSNICEEIDITIDLAACPCVNPNTFTVSGGGSYCAGGTGNFTISLSNSETGINYQLKNGSNNVGSPNAGTGAGLTFENISDAGTYTVVATRVAGGCSVTMTGSAIVSVISLPSSFNVTGGGPYCAGSAGSEVGLASSQTGVNYQLKKGGNNVGSSVAGTGNVISFGNQTEAGTYTVVATTATGGCTSTMGGNAVVSVIALPTTFAVTGGGSYCSGGTGLSVGLSGSESGVSYQLKKGGANVGSAVAGTGSALSFGLQTGGGTYTVEASKAGVSPARIGVGAGAPPTATTCTQAMTGSVDVTVISLPSSFNVTGGGPYCAGSAGSEVGLASSQTGVNYQLKKGGNNVGSSVAGTGNVISFGNQTEAGTYTVVATTATGGCTSTMGGNAVVSVIALPTTFAVTGGGSYCSGGTGVSVGLSGSESGVSYQLKKGGANVGSAVAGTGSALSFGLQTGGGTYTVEASKAGASPARIGVGAGAPPTATTCTQAMTGSVDVTVISLPTAYNVTGGGPFCPGEAGVPIGLASSQTGVNYQLKKDGSNVGSIVAGTGSAISFGLQTVAGVYTVGAATATGGCEAMMISNQMVIVKSAPTAFSVTGGGNFCQGGAGVLVGLSGSESGVTYQLKKDNEAIGSAATGTGSTISFGSQASTGTYTVLATKMATACTSNMTSSAVVAYFSLPLATISGTTTACKGGAGSILTFTGSNGTAPYTFSYQLNGGTVQTVTTTGGSSTATVSQSSSAEGVYNYTLVSVSDVNCSQSQSGSAVVQVQTKPVITLSTLQQTLNEGNSQTFCDTDANPVNGLQFTVSGLCVVGNPVWRVQVGSGTWSDWSTTAPVAQPSNNQPHRYQAACDASCPSTYTSPIELTINYRASTPQNVLLVADGVSVNAGETKDICNIEGNVLTFNATCGVGEVLLYSVDGGDYGSVTPTQMVDGQYHNYRVRCRKSDGTASCVETESGVMRIRLTSMSMVPLASLNVTSGCGLATSFIGTSNCGSMSTIWYNAVTNEALAGLPSQTPSETTSYYVRCQATGGCMSAKSNVVTYTVASVSEVPVVVVSADVVCTGVDVTVSTSCPAGSSALWNTGVTEPSFVVSFANVTKQSYSVRCVYANGCQSSVSATKEVMWKAFELTIINIGESKSGIKTNSRSAWANQFVTPDGGPSLDQSTQENPTLYFSENLNKTAPRYWTIHVDACSLGESGSLTYDLLAVPETGVVRSYNTHENSAPYFMFANRSGYTELYAQNHPLYGFYESNGAGSNVYDEGFPKGLYKLGIRYWDMKGWGSIYPSTRKPQGNVLAYQEYWFRIQSKDGIGVGAARVSGLPFTVEGGQHSALEFATVLPNPVTNVLRLRVQESKGQVVQTSLTDATGREVLRRQFVPETNTHQEEFGVSELPTGMYFLQILTPDKQATLKVVKVK